MSCGFFLQLSLMLAKGGGLVFFILKLTKGMK